MLNHDLPGFTPDFAFQVIVMVLGSRYFTSRVPFAEFHVFRFGMLQGFLDVPV